MLRHAGIAPSFIFNVSHVGYGGTAASAVTALWLLPTVPTHAGQDN